MTVHLVSYLLWICTVYDTFISDTNFSLYSTTVSKTITYEVSASDKVILKVENGSQDFFIGFNRQTGVNSGTQEAGDQVTIIRQASGYAISTLMAKLQKGQSFTISNYQGGSEDVLIEVTDINLSATPAYAKVSVYRASCPPGSCNAGCGGCCSTNSDCVSEQSCATGICNADGTCSFDTSTCLSSTLRMEVSTDYYPEETTWEITDDCNGGAVVMKGGPYNQDNTLYTQEIAVNPSKFSVRVYDAWGDGVCCYYGLGSIKATLDGTEIVSGGQFGRVLSGSIGSC